MDSDAEEEVARLFMIDDLSRSNDNADTHMLSFIDDVLPVVSGIVSQAIKSFSLIEH